MLRVTRSPRAHITSTRINRRYMEKLWRMRVEIEVEPGDLDVDPGYEKGFMNVVTWATSAESAKVKLADYLRTFKWQLLGVEHSAEVDDGEAPDSEAGELINRA